MPCKLSYIVATVYVRLNMVSAGGNGYSKKPKSLELPIYTPTVKSE